LNDALNDLPDREKMIIQRRRLNDEGSTLEELGIDFGVSKERVRQLEARALIKIRNSLEGRVPEISDLPFLS
jgi:RNA polymerase sigma-32 factor